MSAAFPSRPYVARPSAVHLPAMEERFVLLPPYVYGRQGAASVAAELPPAELPSIDEFLDRVPPIEQFAPTGGSPVGGEGEGDWPAWGGEAQSPAPASGSELTRSELTRDDWQGYDWGSAARLGSAPPGAAADAWAATDWREPGGSRKSRQSAAEALARALDQIARRIRAGELRMPGPETAQDDTAIAATLSALLGIRR